MRKNLIYFIILTVALFIASACSTNKYIPEGKYLLKDVDVVSDNDDATKQYSLTDYIIQTPNSKWFGAKIPLKFYCLLGTDTTKWTTRILRRIGEAPVIYDSISAEKSQNDIVQTLNNSGFMKATVTQEKNIKGKKMSLTYNVSPGERYKIRKINYSIDDKELAKVIHGELNKESLLRPNIPFDINTLNNERSRITNYLKNIGYYKFNKEYITFFADTCKGSTLVDVTMNIIFHLENGRSEPEPHRQYKIGDISYFSDINPESEEYDSIIFKGSKIMFKDKQHFRPSLLTSNTMFHKGDIYNEEKLQRTYTNYTRLPAISYSNIRLHERPGTDTLDCRILVNHSHPYSISLDVEGTNSAGDLGAALSASFQNNNLFKGSETLTLKLRGAYEAITGLEGYDGHNYIEFGGEASIKLPAFLMPFVSREWSSLHNATSEIALQYNMQNRPEFKRRVLGAAWRYKWNSPNRRVNHRFDLLEVNYVYMPWMSPTFKEQYLDSIGKTNAILKYNYENLLITKLGYTYTYNSLGPTETTYGKNAYTIRAGIETSGNVLYGITNLADGKRNSDGQYTFCGIAYAQYVKGDFDFSRSLRIDKNNSLAIHAAVGIAYPYGNSNVLPFEKRYFSGGANSVRGWSVRSLGPGSYSGTDRGINFINQSGDIKLDLNLEYRAFLFWKLNGAFFIDAGNIWTIRDYKDQPGGAFRFDEFYKQIAVSYGIGLRMNLDFFIIRFDGGMKAINPAYSDKRKYPIIDPDFGRDFAFHFAVGLPF